MNTFLRRDYRYLVVGAIGVLFAHWAAETWWHWISHFEHAEKWSLPEDPPLWLGLAVTITFVLIFPWVIIRLKNLWQQPFSRLHQKDPPALPVLIWFLSFIPEKTAATFKEGIPPWFKTTGNLDNDITMLEKMKAEGQFWSWEMTLRGIQHHLKKLRVLLLVASKDSILQVHWLRNVLKQYPVLARVQILVLINDNGRTAVRQCPDAKTLTKDNGWDFEDFNEQSEAFADALRLLNEGEVKAADGSRVRAKDREIMIDFTGGQKPASVVAAAITFRRPVQAEYVSTNEPFKVIGYDFDWHNLDHEVE
jgi:hypothetical protein